MKHKFYLSLDDNELKSLQALISDESNTLNNLFENFINIQDQDAYVKHHVYLSLSDISGFNIDDFDNNSDLKIDLGLSMYHKKALKNYFQKIVKELNSINIITVKECEGLIKVNDCLKLVKSKI